MVWVYTSETKKLRRATDDQLALTKKRHEIDLAPFLLPRIVSVTEEAAGRSCRVLGSITNPSVRPAFYISLILCNEEGSLRVSNETIPYAVSGEDTDTTSLNLGILLSPADLRSRFEEDYPDMPEELISALTDYASLPFAALIFCSAEGRIYATYTRLDFEDTGQIIHFATKLFYPRF